MGKDVFPIYKHIGESPLDAVKRVKKENPDLAEEKIAYAGRLDPMAEGALLLVKGDELKRFDEYLNLDKEYEAELIFGFSTDTYDVLGVPAEWEKKKPEKQKIEEEAEKFKGKITFPLPPFSGYKVKGKPLFWWALKGKIEEIDLPQKEVEVYDIDIKEEREITKRQIEKEVLRKVDLARGDFRQKTIKEEWRKALRKKKEERFLLLRVGIRCGSGFYVRSFAQILGERLGTGAVLFSLKRKSVGKYMVDR